MASPPQTTFEPLPLPDRATLTDAEAAAEASAFLARMKTRHTVRHYSDRPVARQIIADCVAAAGRAPSGANQQPWHFAAIAAPQLKAEIRRAAEAEEAAFYEGGAGDAWLKALEPIGTGPFKPHLEIAPWLIVVFAQRWGIDETGARHKHYYVPESVGIATGVLLTAIHHAGLVTLTHTPNPMGFLNDLLGRPPQEKPVMIIAVGHPADDATVPKAAKWKKPLADILSIHE